MYLFYLFQNTSLEKTNHLWKYFAIILTFIVFILLIKMWLNIHFNGYYYCYSVNNKYVIFRRWNHYFIYYYSQESNKVKFIQGNTYILNGNYKKHFYLFKNMFYQKYSYEFTSITSFSQSHLFYFLWIEKIKQLCINNVHNLFASSLLFNSLNKNNIDSKLSLINSAYLLCVSAIHMYIFKKIGKILGVNISTNYYIKWILIFICGFYYLLLSYSIPYLRFFIYYLLLKSNRKSKKNPFNNLWLSFCIIGFINFNDILTIGFFITFLYSYFFILINKKKKLLPRLFSGSIIYVYLITISAIIGFWLNGFFSLWLLLTTIILTFQIEFIFLFSWISIFIPNVYLINNLLISIFKYQYNFMIIHNLLIYFAINFWQLLLFITAFTITLRFILFWNTRYLDRDYVASILNIKILMYNK